MTADQDLSARLLPCPFCGMRLEYAAPVIYVHPIGKCILSGRNFKKGVIGQWGKRVASADHERAVQAAVAKEVEAERARIITAMRSEADDCPCDEDAAVIADCADLIEADFSYDDCEKLKIAREATAIRARKGDAL